MSNRLVIAVLATVLLLAVAGRSPADINNVAMYKPAWQTTTNGQYVPDLAVNGNFDDYTHTDGETGIRVYRTGVSPSDFPDIDSDFDSLRLKLRYQKSDRLDIDLNLRYESFETNDWALAGVAPDTIPTVLTLGADPYDYSVWVVGVGFRYLIGARDISFPE